MDSSKVHWQAERDIEKVISLFTFQVSSYFPEVHKIVAFHGLSDNKLGLRDCWLYCPSPNK